MRAPLSVQFLSFSFSCSFWQKSFGPNSRVGAHLWEILDPPLILLPVFEFTPEYRKYSRVYLWSQFLHLDPERELLYYYPECTPVHPRPRSSCFCQVAAKPDIERFVNAKGGRRTFYFVWLYFTDCMQMKIKNWTRKGTCIRGTFLYPPVFCQW